MKSAAALFGTLIMFPLVIYAGAFSLAAEGNLSADLYETDYFAGLSPEYRFRWSGRHEILLALPLRLRGEAFFRDDYTQHTRFFSIGADAGWFQEIFSTKKIRLLWGADVYFNYGLPPVTQRTMGDTSQKVHYARYFVHSGGVTLPVRFEVDLGKYWGIRLTERLFGIQFDSRWVEGYSSSIGIEAGLKPALSPVVAAVVYFHPQF